MQQDVQSDKDGRTRFKSHELCEQPSPGSADCPTCGAKAQHFCFDHGGKNGQLRCLMTPHPARYEAAGTPCEEKEDAHAAHG